MLPLFILAALTYGAASFAFGAGSDESSAIKNWARGLLAAAALLHFGTIGAQCVDGHHPFQSVFLAMSLGMLITVAGFLAISARRRPMRALGAVLAPLGLVGLTLGVVMSATGGVQSTPEVSATLMRSHIALATLGVAGFTLAAGVAGLYLGMERRLRNKQFQLGQATQSGLSLRGLDKLHWWIVLLVTPVFTLAIVTGSMILTRDGGADLYAERGVEMAAGVVAFLATTAALVSRAVWGLRGRKAAWLTMVAFLSMVMILVSYALRS